MPHSIVLLSVIVFFEILESQAAQSGTLHTLVGCDPRRAPSSLSPTALSCRGAGPADERKIAETNHDEVVKLMVGG